MARVKKVITYPEHVVSAHLPKYYYYLREEGGEDYIVDTWEELVAEIVKRMRKGTWRGRHAYSIFKGERLDIDPFVERAEMQKAVMKRLKND